MTLREAIADFEKFIEKKTTLRPVFADVILNAAAGGTWIPTAERQPEKNGVYYVTVLNREWDRKKHEIISGMKPPQDENWEDHKMLYAQLPDGRWVKEERRIFRNGAWSGYQETVIAWMDLPRPYTGD